MARILRLGPLVLALAGCVLLVAAEFSTLTSVQVITVRKGSITGGEHHTYALAIIAVAAALMAWAATVGGSRPATWALLALAAAALGVVLLVDLPAVSEEGLVGTLYEQAKASPEIGFYLESAGAVVLFFAGVARLVLGPVAVAERTDRRDAAVTPA